MNERIRELADQAWDYALDHETVNGKVAFDSFINKNFSDLLLEKFAELIVAECCDWIDGSPTSESGCQLLLTKSFIIANLKGHFGI